MLLVLYATLEIQRGIAKLVNKNRESGRASLRAHEVKNPPSRQETGVDPWVGKISWRRAWRATPVFLPGEPPWTEEPGGLQSTGSRRVGYNRATKHSTADCLFGGWGASLAARSVKNLLAVQATKV